MLALYETKNPTKEEVSSLKKAITIIQWVVTFVSSVMNSLFLSPQASGIENLHKLAEMKTEKGLGIVFISNHTNCNDPFVETAFLPDIVKDKIFPITFLATHERFGGMMKSFVMKMLGCIPVGNGSGQNVREAIKRIKNGETIYLFPEGKISLGGGIGKDMGALEMFSKFSDIIVQPVHIDGLKHFWDIKNMLLMKRRVRVIFGNPFVLARGLKIDAVEVICSLQKKDPVQFTENMAS